MPQDIKLDPNSHDLVFENFDIVMLTGIEYLLQKVKIKLGFFFKEWFLDTSKGVDYFGTMFVKNPEINAVDNMLKATILEVDGVIDLSKFQSDFNISLRKYTLDFKANTIYGDLAYKKEFAI